MADYPTSKLDKALAQRGFSTASKPAWRELFERHASVPASKALQAPEAIKGFAGSWAAQFDFEEGVRSEGRAEGVAPVQRQINRLGQPGMPEINFRPYDVNTGRSGPYGPSLLGHPISFSVIGPTLRSPQCDHQWRVDTSGAADLLVLDDLTALSTAGSPESLPLTRNSVPDIYGISAIPDAGLYLVISATGDTQSVTDGAGGSVTGGLGDTLIGDDGGGGPGGLPREAIVPSNRDAKFEIFRVVGIATTNTADDTLVLDEGKRISDYFGVPGGRTPMVRAIMLFKPAAARVVAVPGSGTKGKEQVFTLVPPETALNSDFQPPAQLWTTAGGFDPWDEYASAFVGTQTGSAAFFDQNVALPNVVPLDSGECRIEGVFGEVFTPVEKGTIRVVLDSSAPFDAAADVGRLIRITSVRKQNNGDLISVATLGAGVTEPGVERVIGYWEIVDTDAGGGLAGANVYQLRRIAQFDPDTGQPFYWDSNLFQMETAGLASGDEIWMEYTLHDSIADMHRAAYLSPAEIFANRIDMLIDPSWAGLTTKGRVDPDTIGHPARPDRAIFETASSANGASGSNSDPGSLLDLGFRAVLFPARVGASGLEPDFDRPIDANEVVLDPALLDEKQWAEVDYSSGLIHLSHAPVAGAGCQLCPDAATLTDASNPRGEMTFFVSCVPFSAEPGQRGVGPRITAGASAQRAGDFCGIENVAHGDIYGARKVWPLAVGQTITSGVGTTIELDVRLTALDLPAQGFVDLVQGNLDPSQPGLSLANLRMTTWGYSQVIYSDPGNSNNTTLIGCFGGSEHGVGAVSPTVAAPWSAVLRRNVEMPSDFEGRHGTDFQFDTTFGFSKRASALRFRYGQMQHERDGSVVLDYNDPRVEAHEDLFADLFSSWVVDGGTMTTSLPSANAGQLDFTEMVVLIEGVRSVLPAQTVQVDLTAGDRYVYIDGSNPKCPVYATAPSPLPLDSTGESALVGLYTHNTVDVQTYTDLRQPMVNIDKRLDVTVGRPTGHQFPSSAHFATLKEAVDFVRETSFNPQTMGKFRRIVVVGPTTEDPATLPISLNGVSGLIIEGASWHHDGSLGVFEPEVFWKGDSTFFFDMDGATNCVFRNLVFRYDEDGTGNSTVPSERTLFGITTSSVASNHVIENVTLTGPAHGFFLVEKGTVDNVTVRNCRTDDATDFGIYVDAGADGAGGWKVENCNFVVRSVGDTPLSDGGCIVSRHSSSPGWWVVNNTLTGGAYGVLTGLNLATIQGWVVRGNYISGAQLGALRVECAQTRVGGNRLTSGDIQIQAAGCTLSGNHIDGAGFGITLSTTSNLCQNNHLEGPVRVLADDNVVIGNRALDIITSPSSPSTTYRSNCEVIGNQFTLLPTSGPHILLFDNSTISGNEFAAGVHMGVAGSPGSGPTSTVFAHNHVVGVDPGFSESLRVEAEAGILTIQGNHFAGAVRLGEAAGFVSGSRVVDNYIAGNLIAYISGSVVHGNRVTGGLGVSHGGDTTVAHNIITGVQTEIGGGPSYALAYDGTVTRGVCSHNIFLNDGYFSGGSITIEGNVSGKDLLFDSMTECSIIGNLMESNMNAATVQRSIFSGNHVGGQGSFLVTCDRVTLQGNHFQGKVTLLADDCRVAGNYILTEFTLGGGGVWNLTLVGNFIGGDADLSVSSDARVLGNHFAADTTFDNSTRLLVDGNTQFQGTSGAMAVTNCEAPIVKGNRLGQATGPVDLDLRDSDNYICMGNLVNGSLLIDAGASTTNGGIVIGNRATLIGDGAAGAAPGNYQITMGNKVDNGAGGTVYGVNPAMVTVNANNISDDV